MKSATTANSKPESRKRSFFENLSLNSENSETRGKQSTSQNNSIDNNLLENLQKNQPIFVMNVGGFENIEEKKRWLARMEEQKELVGSLLETMSDLRKLKRRMKNNLRIRKADVDILLLESRKRQEIISEFLQKSGISAEAKTRLGDF